MIIDHLCFVTLNLYETDTVIFKYDAKFTIQANGLENTFNKKQSAPKT